MNHPFAAQVPCGATVQVSDKQFSDHPAQHCVPRLRLTAPVHGWVSQRLNREPPDDLEVVELVGVSQAASHAAHATPVDDAAHAADPAPASTGRVAGFHAMATRVGRKDRAASNGERHLAPEKVGDAINAETLCVVCLSRATVPCIRPPALPPSLPPDARRRRSARNATFVHGETGHIACCLECARALRARGDTCPVCRTPIDLVIQHFWA